MNKAKRILAIFLSFVMVLSLASCGEKKQEKKTALSYMNSISEIKSGDIESTITIKFSGKGEEFEAVKDLIGEEIILTMKGQQDEGSSKLNISAKFNNNTYDLTDMIFKDDTYYIDMYKMLDVLMPYIAKYMGADSESMKSEDVKQLLGAQYMSFSMDDLKYFVGMSKDLIASNNNKISNDNLDKLDINNLTAIKNYVQVASDVFDKDLTTTLESVEPKVITDIDNGFKFELNSDNVEALVKAFSKLLSENGEKLFDEFKAKLKDKVGVEDSFYKTITGSDVDVKTSIEKMVEELNSTDLSEFKKLNPSLIMNVTCTGDAGKRVANMDTSLSTNDKSEGNSIDVSFGLKINENKEIEIAVPQNVISYTALMEKLKSL